MINSDLPVVFAPIIIVAALWSIFWKGTALWHAARKGDNVWFIVMMAVNTLGILEIIYLFGFAKIKFKNLFK